LLKYRLSDFKVDNYKNIKINFKKIKKGNANEREKLIKKYLKMVINFATNKQGLNEDLLQELLTKIFEDVIIKFDNNRGIKFSTYLHNSLSNIKENYYKKMYNNSNLSLNYKFDDIEFIDQLKDDLEIEKKYMNNQVEEYIINLVNNLDDENKRIIKFYYGVNCPTYTLREIGEKVGLSFNGVKFKLDNIKSYFKKRISWDNFV